MSDAQNRIADLVKADDVVLFMERARVPLERMLEMAGRTVGQGDVGKPIIDTPEKIDPAISGD